MAVPMTGPEETAAAPGTPRRGRTTALVAAIAAVVLAGTAVTFYRWGSASAPRPPAGATASPSASPRPSIPAIYAAVAPSVVSIEATRSGADPGAATGTGVVVNADATILTALHVVKGAGAIRVRFADGTTSAATVAAADPAIDIAVLSPATLPSIVVPAVLGSSSRLAVGDSVVAIGDQLRLTRTTTTGVVSGLNRRATGTGGAGLTGLIQFDAAVNPGSSGGPLINGEGQTVGIVVALANPTSADTFIGVGFAVPIGAAVAAGDGDRAPQQ